MLGDSDAALASLERAVTAGLRWPANMTPDPDLAILQDDSRYAALRERALRR